MRPDKVYIDTMFLIRWFLSELNRSKKLPFIIKLLIERTEIKKFISVFSILEIIRVLKYDKKFRKFDLEVTYIKKLIEKLQNDLDFEIIMNKEANGIFVSNEVVKFIEIHDQIMDCIHFDIAKNNNLCLLTDDKKIGNLKTFYKNIMTENKFRKQFN